MTSEAIFRISLVAVGSRALQEKVGEENEKGAQQMIRQADYLSKDGVCIHSSFFLLPVAY